MCFPWFIKSPVSSIIRLHPHVHLRIKPCISKTPLFLNVAKFHKLYFFKVKCTSRNEFAQFGSGASKVLSSFRVFNLFISACFKEYLNTTCNLSPHHTHTTKFKILPFCTVNSNELIFSKLAIVNIWGQSKCICLEEGVQPQ